MTAHHPTNGPPPAASCQLPIHPSHPGRSAVSSSYHSPDSWKLAVRGPKALRPAWEAGSSLLLWTLLTLSPATSHASLYTDIHTQVEDEVAQTMDPTVAEFVARQFKVSVAKVEAAARNDTTLLCGGMDRGPCNELLKDIQLLLSEELRVRHLGRFLLQQIAGSELSVSDVYGHPMALPLDEAAIVNLWTTEAGGVTLAPGAKRMRTMLVDDASVLPLLQQLTTAFTSLPPDERPAAVQRYRHGIRLVLGSRSPVFPKPAIPPGTGPGTEQPHTSAQWPSIENPLLSLWNALPDASDFSPPLALDEVAYFRFPSSLQSVLPPNLLVWAQIDGNEPSYPSGDIGLAWRIPIDPAFPSLLPPSPAHGIIPGGTYPSPLSPEGQLCTHPLAARGYLCRPVADSERCPRPTDADPAKITLSTCTIAAEQKTLSGPDVCRETDWRDGDFDPLTQCRLEITCKPPGVSCTPGFQASALVGAKDINGTIPFCMMENVEAPATYIAFHELVHVYQLCSYPPGTSLFTGATLQEVTNNCCQIEGEGYRAQCQMMEADGLFHHPDGSRKVSPSTGIPYDTETCTEAWTHFGCAAQKNLLGCQWSRKYTASFLMDMATTLSEAKVTNPGRVPVTCSGWKARGEPRTDLLIRTIGRKRPVCQPGVQTTYKNRIGNNMCFLGQCAEEIFELKELGGRTPATMADAGSPWFPAASARRSGLMLDTSTPLQRVLPTYAPALLLQEFDAALCKLAGLPPRSPPVQCIVGVQRRLDLPLLDYASTMMQFLRQRDPQAQITSGLDRLAGAYGHEAGGLLLRNYLRSTLPSLAHSLSTVNELLTELRDLPFPAQMCPLGQP